MQHEKLLRTLMKDARGDLIRYSRMALPPSSSSQEHPAQVQPCSSLESRQAAVENSFDATLRFGVVDPRGYAGIVNCSPRESTAQAIRAFLAAIATIARQ
jgi:hypothetical protein